MYIFLWKNILKMENILVRGFIFLVEVRVLEFGKGVIYIRGIFVNRFILVFYKFKFEVVIMRV